MKPESQRIAIAEACGELPIKQCRNIEQLEADITRKDLVVTILPDGSITATRDYLTDLNAMHEAEKACLQTEARCDQYAALVQRLVMNNPVEAWQIQSWTLHATAAQRAEAFLRTIGKWEDDKDSPSLDEYGVAH